MLKYIYIYIIHTHVDNYIDTAAATSEIEVLGHWYRHFDRCWCSASA